MSNKMIDDYNQKILDEWKDELSDREYLYDKWSYDQEVELNTKFNLILGSVIYGGVLVLVLTLLFWSIL